MIYSPPVPPGTLRDMEILTEVKQHITIRRSVKGLLTDVGWVYAIVEASRTCARKKGTIESTVVREVSRSHAGLR